MISVSSIDNATTQENDVDWLPSDFRERLYNFIAEHSKHAPINQPLINQCKHLLSFANKQDMINVMLNAHSIDSIRKLFKSLNYSRSTANVMIHYFIVNNQQE